MPKKRGPGEGSIFQLPDGRWAGFISLGFRNGKRWRKKIEAPTLADLNEKITAAKRDHQLGINIAPERQTVADFLKDWLENVKADVRPSTFISYHGHVHNHIIPALGRYQLSKLRAQHIQAFKRQKLAEVMKSGPGVPRKIKEGEPRPEPRQLSARTVQYSLVVLRMALQEACKLDLIPRNPAVLVDYPAVANEEIRPFTPEEAKQFLEAAKGNRLEALFSVALALGLRKGEALGLQWPDIDFEAGTLSVRRALQRLKMPGEKKGRLVVSEPKRRSRRTINLPQVALSALAEHRRRQEQERSFAGDQWQETGFVFTSSIGTPLEPRKAAKEYTTILEAAGLPVIRFHDLRHTAATLLLAQGVHPRVVMELLGHSQIAITMNTYSHVIPALKKEAANQMDAILNPVATVVATVGKTEKVN